MLTIGVSTNLKNIIPLCEKLDKYTEDLYSGVNFLIISQSVSNFTNLKINQRVKCVYNSAKGLSSNRNLSIEHCTTDWLWFQDDDIELNVNETNQLCRYLETTAADLVFTQIGSLEDQDELYKNYAFHKAHRSLNAFKISSIEIVVRKEFLTQNAISFDKKLGLGTTLPCCEENDFIWKCFEQTTKVFYSNQVVCFHTTVPESRAIDYAGRYKARGYFLNKIPLYFAVPIFFRWVLRRTSVTRLNKVTLMIEGYFTHSNKFK